MATTEVDVQTAKGWIDAGEASLVDVREPDEHAGMRIAGARLVPLSKFDASLVPADKKKVVLHCRSGRRSLDALRMLANAGRVDGVYSMKGGIEAWKSAGLPTVAGKSAPISILRQVQIVAGSIVVTGVVLGVTVSPWFLILSGFIGGGLVFAGLSGFCGMAALLAKMPWNSIPGACPER